MSKILLEANDLTIGYRQKRKSTAAIAADLNLNLAAGELVCLLGANGSGKSTLLRTLAGMQPMLSGRITIEGESLAAISPQDLAKKLSVVLTERVDVGLLSAYDLVTLGRFPYTDWRGELTSKDQQIVRKVIQAVGAVELAARPVNELSDGERQKIMIARALAQEPTIMILDEPTAFLDLPRRVEIMHILRKLARGSRRAFLLSTHDLDLAMRTADKIWLFSGDNFYVGTPEDLVLSGVFAEAFASEGVTFDPQNGAFQIKQSANEAIGIVGSGITLNWTIRALERAGFNPIVGQKDLSLVVECADAEWIVYDGEQTHRADSIESLLEVLS
ncbi:MAG: ABC transporter ATP-binding protein [Ardenticatenaceae bacterium]|nr:ABC transporter ATP-binding protein [Ardenticatenaceae bacterium]